MKRKNYIFMLLLITIIVISGCSSNSAITTFDEQNILSENDFISMYSDTEKYIGSSVDFYGRVFSVEKDEDGTYLQVMSDIENFDKNTLISINDPDLKVEEDNLVHVQGVVNDTFDGENAFGGTIAAPVISASSLTVVSYIEAVSPTIKTIDVNQQVNQYNYIMDIQKIELAESETRVYFKITNNSEDNVSFYSFNTKIIQGSKQFEQQDNYEAAYAELQSDISPGVTTEGVVAFPAIDQNINQLQVTSEGSSDNYDNEFELYKFDISW